MFETEPIDKKNPLTETTKRSIITTYWKLNKGDQSQKWQRLTVKNLNSWNQWEKSRSTQLDTEFSCVK